MLFFPFPFTNAKARISISTPIRKLKPSKCTYTNVYYAYFGSREYQIMKVSAVCINKKNYCLQKKNTIFRAHYERKKIQDWLWRKNSRKIRRKILKWQKDIHGMAAHWLTFLENCDFQDYINHLYIYIYKTIWLYCQPSSGNTLLEEK